VGYLMTKQDMAKILRILQEHYRSEGITEKTVLAWHPIFEDYEYEEVKLAVKMLAREREFTSFPAPASLVKYIEIIRGKKSPTQLWDMAYRAMTQASTYTRETFAELPAELQEFFGSINQLRDYGMQDMDKVSYVKASFMRALPIIESRIMASKEWGKLKNPTKGYLDTDNTMIRQWARGYEDTDDDEDRFLDEDRDIY
jgi:hypothetical protein